MHARTSIGHHSRRRGEGEIGGGGGGGGGDLRQRGVYNSRTYGERGSRVENRRRRLRDEKRWEMEVERQSERGRTDADGRARE